MKYKRISRISTAHRLLLVAAGLALALAAAAPAWAAQPTSRALLLQGDRYAAQGKWDSARASYVRALEAGAVLDRDFLRSRNLGRAYMKGKDPDYAEAAKWLARALQLRPNAQGIRPLLARSQAESGDYKGAAEQYGVLAKAQPANSKLLLAWANALVHDGESGQAAAAVEEYMGKHPADAATRLDFARMLTYDRSNFDQAIRQYQAVLRADPNNLAAQVGVAKVMSWQDRLDISLELYDKVLTRDPQNYDAMVGKAFTLLWMKRKEEAHALLEVLALRNPSDKEVARVLAALEAPPPVAAAPPAPPAPPPMPTEERYVQTLIAAAEAASSRGDYVGAIHEYHRALERDPGNLKAKLQIARVLSWAKNYQESAQQYEEVLQATPDDLAVRRERARVLSWASLFDQAIPEYERVLKEAEAAQNAGREPQVPVGETRLEFARVLSWAQRYPEAMAQFDLLLPEARPREPKDKALLIEKARVLSWMRRYDDSIRTYDQALTLEPGDYSARFGRAQALSWSGHLDEAASQLRPLLAEKPQQPEASFLLASVERGRGYNSRALALLKDAPQNAETEKLRSGIRADLRPLLYLRYGFEDSRLIPPSSTETTYTAHRFTAGIEFFPHPDVKMEVFNTVTDANTSNRTLARHGIDALATETFARVTLKAAPWLRLVLGAGGGTGGRGTVCSLPLSLAPPCNALAGVQENRRQRFLYEIHPIIVYHDLRLDFVATRRLAEYDSLAIHDNVVLRRESVQASYFWRRRLRLGAEYWHGTYNLDSPDITLATQSFETAANGGNWWVRPILYRNDRVTVDAGFRMEMFGFDDRVVPIATNLVSGGFFSPQRLERYEATGHVSWDPHPKVHWDFDGSLGPQRVTGFRIGAPPPTQATCSAAPTTTGCPPSPQFGISGSFSTGLTLRLGHWSPFLAYTFYKSSTPTFPTFGNGAYRSHAFTAGLSYRF